MRIAYLSQGRLFVKDDGAPATQVTSPFGQDLIDRTAEIRQRHAWKTEGRGGLFQGAMVWGQPDCDDCSQVVRYTAVTRGNEPGQVSYALQFGVLGGLFSQDLAKQSERRHFHKNDYHTQDLDRNPKDGSIACSLMWSNGTASIGLTDAEGKSAESLTEGDVVDIAPAWLPSGEALLYQSAGVGRDAEGDMVGLGPFAIQRLDIETDALTTVLEDEAHDFLQPRMDAKGRLYFIRRPYEAPGSRRGNLLTAVVDTLLLPYRLLGALFHFLNTFSLFFSGNPLSKSAGPTQMPGPDMKQVLLWGRWVEVEHLIRKAKSEEDPRALVPDTWQLVRRETDGAESVLASGVVSYDLAPDGTVVYSNGMAVYSLNAEGKRKRLCKDTAIERVVALG